MSGMSPNAVRRRAARPELPGFTDVTHVARGGSGDVLRAREPEMGRTVAIKVYTAAGGEACAERELTVAGWLGIHPHLVTVHHRGRTASGLPYVVMPWYAGGNLADEVRRRGPLPVDETLRLGTRLAGALAHLHRMGILHRDVKPANVLFGAGGEPVLADLGLAALPGEPQRPAMGLTPLHAAPEVLRGEPSTPESDVWSLGSTLCSILDRGGLPAELARLLDAATATDPNARPPDGAALAAGLQAVQARLGLPVTEIPGAATPSTGTATPPTGVTASPTGVTTSPTGTATPSPGPVARRRPVPTLAPLPTRGRHADPWAALPTQMRDMAAIFTGNTGSTGPVSPAGPPVPVDLAAPADPADLTLLRDPPPPEPSRWPVIAVGAVGGAVTGLLALGAAAAMHPW